MKVLPVITRELRAQSRQPFTYWLRALGVVALLGGAILFINERLFEANLGGALFGLMHLLGYCAIWFLVPLGVADCISRERREGTLGLLFLTPLKPPHIVIAKSIAHGLRALTLVIAIVPALTIPFLLGGVIWQQALVSAVVNLSAVCWCLAAALAASSLARNAGLAMALAMVLAFGGFLFFPWTVGAILGLNSQNTWTNEYSQSVYDFFVGFAVVGMSSGQWGSLFTMFKAPQIFGALSMAVVISGAALVLAVIFAADRIRRSWRDEPPSARVQQAQKVFCEPVLGVKFLRGWMQRKLERNPIGWLEQRRWSGRLVTWAWFAIIISVYSAVLTDRNFFRGYGDIQYLIGWLLAVSMAVSAAGSFRRERETGVLELLLVSPLSTRQIISGRLWGLWGQFFPAAVTLLGIWAYFITIFRSGNTYSLAGSAMSEIWFFAVSFLVIPVVGLYFSVQCRHFIGALLLTLAFVFVVPPLLSFIVKFSHWSFASGNDYFHWRKGMTVSICFFQVLIAGYLGVRLRRNLEQRTFPLERGVA
jgi:ABC-type transport system involved in multi-copper enzyme maturation permease subunit